MICATFKGACSRRGLLDDDVHLIDAMGEIAQSQSSSKLRKLFVTIACCCNPTKLKDIWTTYEDSLCEDHVRRARVDRWDFTFTLTDEIRATVLQEIEESILFQGGQPLSSHGIRIPMTTTTNATRPNTNGNSMVERERRNMNIDDEAIFLAQQLPTLNEYQQLIFDEVVRSIVNSEPRCFFISSSAGSGKSYLLNTIIAYLRSIGRIVLATAASACASLVLRGATTLHSRLKVPIAIHPDSTCNISRGSELANLVMNSSLIIIDECTMLHRNIFEAIDWTLKDLARNDVPFGGKIVLLSGDFKQCLPIIPGGSRAQIVDASVRFSVLWNNLTKRGLPGSMRHTNQSWIDFLEDIGKGIRNDCDGKVEIEHVTIHRCQDTLTNEIYPNITTTASVPNDVAILAPLNTTVDILNNKIIDLLPGTAISYISVDTPLDETDLTKFPTEFLNKQESGSLPPHHLRLKIGCPVVVIRNIMPPHLLNGTRGIVIQLYPNVIEIEKSDGACMFIPRITIAPSDNSRNFVFKRRQFPIKLALAMTINRAEGQTLRKTGLDLTKPCFSHGQLYKQ